ncbi:polysaccharide biosynthesis tyrosine autokinase (plasmid) [Skermanella rosea]|uniref:GumC family protein n=1 Tax=Skermanella rosea TaxID=1817965 RepID=UPI0019330BA1|nr:polysaccharide biosynthesis tyrosine autokinase [Skermanella rosea]UEM07347.1 polysaccharide biosynthesis tyrosine autokinase [Skermanella rosea]
MEAVAVRQAAVLTGNNRETAVCGTPIMGFGMASLLPNDILSDAPRGKPDVHVYHDRMVQGVLDLLWRRKWPLVGFVASVMILTGFVLSQMPPVYNAEAVVQLDTRKTQYVDFNSVVSNLNADALVVRSETDVIRSRAIAARVVDRLKLDAQPVDDPPQSVGHAFLSIFDRIVAWAVASWQAGEFQTFLGAPVGTSVPMTQETIRVAAIDRLLNHVGVTNDGRSYTIRITYSSTDPKEAAQISNAFAEEYVRSQIDSKFETTRQANEWLAASLESARQRVQRATAAVDSFKDENGIGASSDGTPSLPVQQVNEINTQIAQAEAAWAVSQSRLVRTKTQIDAGQEEAVPEVLSSPVIQNMRQTEIALRGDLADLREQFGERHPEVRKINAKIADVDRRIRAEVGHVVASMQAEADSLKIRADMLRDRRDQLQQVVGISNRLQTRLRELDGEVEASRTLFLAIAERYVETSALQNIAQADARIVSLSDPPLLPSGPKVLIILGLTGVMATTGGVGLLLLHQKFDVGFRTANQVSGLANVPCLGMVPLLPTETIKMKLSRGHPANVGESAFAEALRSVRTILRLQSIERPMKVIVVTSSLPEEGKSIFTFGLGMAFSESGLRTLLIDADLRRPALASVTGVGEQNSLSMVLDGQASLDQVVQPVANGRLHVLPAIAEGIRSQDRLGSAAMRRLIEDARGQYDIVLIDTPPVMMVADAFLLLAHSDSVIYLVQWERTPRETVLAGLQRMRQAGVRLSGAVLSQVDLGRHAKYKIKDEGYYYLKNRKHYSNRI